MTEEKNSGWQHDSTGKRDYMEARNELPFPVKVEVVRVKATNNYFIYIRDAKSEDDGAIVPDHYYEVVKITEAEF